MALEIAGRGATAPAPGTGTFKFGRASSYRSNMTMRLGTLLDTSEPDASADSPASSASKYDEEWGGAAAVSPSSLDVATRGGAVRGRPSYPSEPATAPSVSPPTGGPSSLAVGEVSGTKHRYSSARPAREVPSRLRPIQRISSAATGRQKDAPVAAVATPTPAMRLSQDPVAALSAVPAAVAVPVDPSAAGSRRPSKYRESGPRPPSRQKTAFPTNLVTISDFQVPRDAYEREPVRDLPREALAAVDRRKLARMTDQSPRPPSRHKPLPQALFLEVPDTGVPATSSPSNSSVGSVTVLHPPAGDVPAPTASPIIGSRAGWMHMPRVRPASSLEFHDLDQTPRPTQFGPAAPITVVSSSLPSPLSPTSPPGSNAPPHQVTSFVPSTAPPPASSALSPMSVGAEHPAWGPGADDRSSEGGVSEDSDGFGAMPITYHVPVDINQRGDDELSDSFDDDWMDSSLATEDLRVDTTTWSRRAPGTSPAPLGKLAPSSSPVKMELREPATAASVPTEPDRRQGRQSQTASSAGLFGSFDMLDHKGRPLLDVSGMDDEPAARSIAGPTGQHTHTAWSSTPVATHTSSDRSSRPQSSRAGRGRMRQDSLDNLTSPLQSPDTGRAAKAGRRARVNDALKTSRPEEEDSGTLPFETSLSHDFLSLFARSIDPPQ